MTTEWKQTSGMAVLGLVFAATGMVFLITGKTPFGAAMLGVGLGWMIGAAVRRARSRRAGGATEPQVGVAVGPATGTDTGPAVSPQNAR